jgi:hypothetical protein
METDRYGIIPARVPSAIAITLNTSFQSLSPAISNSLERVVLLPFIDRHPEFVGANILVYKIQVNRLRKTNKDTLETSGHSPYICFALSGSEFFPKLRLNQTFLYH